MIVIKGKYKGEPFREPQVEAYEFITNSTKRFICLSAPPGTGKSIVGFESMKHPIFYLCSSIHLEHQLEHDFPEAALLKGRSHYPCEMFESADLCVISPACSDCAYADAKRAALHNSYSILNYHYFMYAANFAGFTSVDGGERNIVIDEADNLENVLTGFIAFTFSMKQLKYLGVAEYPPRKRTVIESFIEWLKPVTRNLIERTKEIVDHIGIIQDKIKDRIPLDAGDTSTLRRQQRLEGALWKANFLNKQDLKNGNWVYYTSNDGKIILKPKWLTRELSDNFLFDHGKRFLFMSATLPPKPVFCGLYGLEPDEVDYLELDHPFAVENRRIIYRGRFKLTSKALHGKE